MEAAMIFNNTQEQSKEFYKKNGYVQYRINSNDFHSAIEKCFKYYSYEDMAKQNTAFRNKYDKPRHFIDIFRDPLSKAHDLYKDNQVIRIIKNQISSNNRFIFTHSKMSFKQINSNGDWYPHQDHGYNFKKKTRDGFAIFICLEDMDENNGCLQIYPKSHLLGPLDHKRHIEDVESLDSQLFIKNMPDGFNPISIIAKKGDIIIFSPTTIHSSLSTKTKSKRLSLIAEIQEFKSIKLDDYGKVPIFAIGSIYNYEKFILAIKKFFNPYFYWHFLRKNKNISLYIRKILHKKD
tara:strand:+ start:336 stop:1211 length:876 start_codon:yes stop_codon:yes gene_type:complete